MTVARWDRYPNRASARRAAARLLHPDRGGSPADFAAALAEIDAQFTSAPAHLTIRRTRRLPAFPKPLRLLRRRRRRYIEI